jgi:nitric oxide reductase activation protein
MGPTPELLARLASFKQYLESRKGILLEKDALYVLGKAVEAIEAALKWHPQDPMPQLRQKIEEAWLSAVYIENKRVARKVIGEKQKQLVTAILEWGLSEALDFLPDEGALGVVSRWVFKYHEKA